jgi:hypothetical protein
MLAVSSGSVMSIAWQFWLDVFGYGARWGPGIVRASPNLNDLCLVISSLAWVSA